MDVVAQSYNLYERARNKGEDVQRLLEQALSLLEREYEKGNRQCAVVNNYGAIMLDLQMNRSALKVLSENIPECSEHCSNLAIAIAKADYNVDLIRHWNRASASYPKQEYAIVAYMDWQGL